jgi:hypothetical protein
MVWSIGGSIPGFNGSYAGEKIAGSSGLGSLFGNDISLGANSGYWNQPSNYDQWANPVFGVAGSTGVTGTQSSSSDPFGGLANVFRPGAMGANSMPQFNTGEMVAGAMAMGAIQRSKDRMMDDYWNRSGYERAKEFMLDDLFNIAPLAEQQKENLGQRTAFNEFNMGNALDAIKDRKLREPGNQLSSPLSTMIPRTRLNTPYGIG